MMSYRGRLFAALLTVAVCAPDLAQAQETVIKMTSARTFEPRTVEVKAGETVVWRNDSMALHTVTADRTRAKKADSVALPDGVTPFSSQHILPASIYRHTFTVPGTYRYFCILNEEVGMVGEVVVR